MTSRLKISTTEYSRGAVVKLTDGADPIAKFIIERDRRSGSWVVLQGVKVQRGKLYAFHTIEHSTHATAADAIHTAERECERIRHGGDRDAA